MMSALNAYCYGMNEILWSRSMRSVIAWNARLNEAKIGEAQIQSQCDVSCARPSVKFVHRQTQINITKQLTTASGRSEGLVRSL